jgi:hypothetical protein
MTSHVAAYSLTLPASRTKGEMTVHQAVELVFRLRNVPSTESKPDFLKFCLPCGRIFGKLISSYTEFLEATTTGSYIENLQNLGRGKEIPVPMASQDGVQVDTIIPDTPVGFPFPYDGRSTRKSQKRTTQSKFPKHEQQKRNKQDLLPLPSDHLEVIIKEEQDDGGEPPEDIGMCSHGPVVAGDVHEISKQPRAPRKQLLNKSSTLQDTPRPTPEVTTKTVRPLSFPHSTQPH